MKTLLLDTDAWDLVLDANGNIAVASEPYALAQDVASAVRTVLGEVYYNTQLGVPYFEDVLGKLPPTALLIELINAQALTVPGVVSVQTIITGFTSRTVSGQIQFTTDQGDSHVVNF